MIINFLVLVVIFLLGALAGVLFIVWRSHQMHFEKEKKSSLHGDKLIYINVCMLNKKEVVTREAKRRVPRVFRGAIGKIANKICTESKFSRTVGQKLAETIPKKLALKQIAANSRCVYIEGPLCIVEVRVLRDEINYDYLLEKNLSRDAVSFLHHAFELLGMVGAKKTSWHILKEEIASKIQNVLKVKLPEEIAKKMLKEKGLKVDVVANFDSEQSAWFYSIIEAMREDKKKHKHKKGETDILKA
eukprot:CAMPEP_0167761442 /NCGR_PEP_ID=MMETSP0110_2-20121227/12175_1 /TAXON_ID=629695 /ORGANISM="Gymnochlora sp., Strain CCMP2014" /LENGTH=244 /DNA_ID=CAMNT_0007648127 /DNA_START=12 /DNA_END=746 /DNA_ORIENTATION=+